MDRTKEKICSIIKKHEIEVEEVLKNVRTHKVCRGVLTRKLADIGIEPKDFKLAYKVLNLTP